MNIVEYSCNNPILLHEDFKYKNVHNCICLYRVRWRAVNVDIVWLNIKGWYFIHMWKAFKHDRIISLRGEVWTRKTSLTPSCFIEVSAPSHDTEQSWICVGGVSIFLLSIILLLDSELFRQCGIFCFIIYISTSLI